LVRPGRHYAAATLSTNDGFPKRAGGKGLGEIDSTLPSPGAQSFEEPPPVTVTEPGAPLVSSDLPYAATAEFVKKGKHRPTPDFADHVGKPVKLSKWTRKRIALTVLASFGGLVVVAAVLLAAFWTPIARWLLHRSAAARGIELEEKSISLSLSSAGVKELEARFTKVKGVVVRAKSATADLSWLTPESVRVEGIEVEADYPQSLMALGQQVTTGGSSDLPLKVQGARVVVKKIAPSFPVGFEFGCERVAHKNKKTDLFGITAKLPIIGYELGPFDLSLVKSGQGIELTTPSLPSTRFVLDAAAKHLTVQVDPQALPFLQTFGVDKKSPPKLGGDVDISLPDASDTLTGVLDATLSNFALPQLEGILPGDLKIAGEVTVSPTGAVFEKLKLEQGALKLTGKGKLSVLGLRAEVDLEGGLPCSAIAGDILSKRFGIPAIGLLGGLLGGSITVKVHIEAAPPSWIPELKVEPNVGCRIGG